MKTFREFILEVNRPEQGSKEEKERWDKVKASLDARNDSSEFYIAALGRDKNGLQRYGTKSKGAKQKQLKTRASNLAFIDSDLDPKNKKSNKGSEKEETIGKRGYEAHHGTPISQSAKEFEGLSPEERKAKRERDAKFGKFHGSDRRNLIQTVGKGGGKGIPHRGKGGYHSRQKPVGTGGSIQDFGSEKEIVAVKKGIERRGYSELEKMRKEKRRRDLEARMNAAYDKRVDDTVNS